MPYFNLFLLSNTLKILVLVNNEFSYAAFSNVIVLRQSLFSEIKSSMQQDKIFKEKESHQMNNLGFLI